MKAKNILMITSIVALIGISSAFAGFTGDTPPTYSNDDGMMHIMDSASGDVTTISAPVLTSTGDTSAMVGNDKDAHGCKGSAGYSYSTILKKCTRSWEINAKTLSGTTWKSTAVDGKRFQKGAISFSSGIINAHMCNGIGGNYTEKNGKISAPILMSTRMYCLDASGEAERKFNLNDASYKIYGNGNMLKITTASGSVFSWKRVE